jgi:uncharacterized protein YecE (DUF72 family)
VNAEKVEKMAAGKGKKASRGASQKSSFHIGTAGWAIPKISRDEFIAADSVKPDHLRSYSQKLSGVEINSAFYREHQPKTYAKWALSTPDGFRFSVKLAKRFTHEQKLVVDTSDLQMVLEGILHLEEKLGVILVQIPPKLAFDEAVAEDFFAALRELYTGPVAFEPRHGSWVEREATRVLEDYQIARVIADPDRLGEAPPIRSAPISYVRLHGSPKVYYSNYEEPALRDWTERLREEAKSKSAVWCIFDNTAAQHATANALTVQRTLNHFAPK